MSKIGLGIITCNREDFYTKCCASIPKNGIDSLISINDGKPYDKPPSRGAYLQHEQNKGVGISKNKALQYLLEQGCEHIFLIEDDIIVKNADLKDGMLIVNLERVIPDEKKPRLIPIGQ